MLIIAHSAQDNNLNYLDQAMSFFLPATQCLSQVASYHFQIAKDLIFYTLHARPYILIKI